ncbi:MAG: molecular chaperone HtpG [Candidatus Borkfalkiaceae bacterium]|nr:molecular chaperone HtpG [Christensenellaceae bacterium]
MKKFKAESKKVLDLMINSIYTNKEIFLRELLSNASDAIDKLYFKSLQLGTTGLSRGDFHIDISVDRENRILRISDNGIGMTEDELENNLGVIAKSGSYDFKHDETAKDALKADDINIIGQFGVGFYSAFMVSDKVEVVSKAYGSDKAYKWTSNGADGYDITEAEKDSYGTDIILHIKPDDENEDYCKYLEEYSLRQLVKKYSNYITYPIRMMCTKYDYDVPEGEEPKKTEELETLNSMVPLWKKNKADITKEEYDAFYKEMFYDGEAPLRTLHFSMEGAVDFKALLFIPSKTPYNYYSRDYEKGLKLYTNGVLITDKCKDLLPDYFSFVRGVVDTDIQLNLSRETVQQSRSLKAIAGSIEKKIKQELENMLNEARSEYEEFFKNFGLQLKFGIYQNYGMNKPVLQDLLLFKSVKQDKYVTLKEYLTAMPEDQKFIYYATGKSVDAIKLMPQLDKVTEKGYDVLCMTDDVDEFTVKFINDYESKQFRNVSGNDLGIEDEDAAEEYKELADFMKETLGDKVEKVRISRRIKNHPVCFTAEGDVSIEMEKVFNAMPNANGQVKAKKVLELNSASPVVEKLNSMFENDKEKAKELTDVLYQMACIIEGMPVENPTALTDAVCKLIAD